MRLQHILNAVHREPWLITAGGHESVARLVEAKLRADGPDFAMAMVNPRRAGFLDANDVGHIHICGVIGHRLGAMEKTCGNTDVCDIRRELDSLTDHGARAIMLCVDSPGGTVTGVQEAAECLADVAASLPVFAYTDTIIASAAYWIASAATQIWSSQTANIGSIGVFRPWIDASLNWEAAGLKWDPIVNTGGTFKAAGDGPSLTPEQRENLQEYVDRVYGLFQGFVVDHRNGVQADAMQGQCLLGVDAVAAGLTDALGTWEDAYGALCEAAGIWPVVSIPEYPESSLPPAPEPAPGQ